MRGENDEARGGYCAAREGVGFVTELMSEVNTSVNGEIYGEMELFSTGIEHDIHIQGRSFQTGS